MTTGTDMKKILVWTIRIIAIIGLVASLCALAVYIIGDVRDNASHKDTQKLKSVLDEYNALYAENEDTIGWLKIDGTDIDHVVMFVENDNEKYLHRDFYGNDSYRGCLFVDGRCDVQTSDNVIIYGHHMKDGSMFGALVDYRDREFYESHRYIQFDTIYEKQRYEVVAAIETALLPEGAEGFRYYEYTDENDAQSFNEYVQFIEQNKLYDTGVELHPGDKLITLSTCAYHTDDGRFIVVAKKLAE